jgi:hypothetical protein
LAARPAAAATGDALILGQQNSADAVTSLKRTTHGSGAMTLIVGEWPLSSAQADGTYTYGNGVALHAEANGIGVSALGGLVGAALGSDTGVAVDAESNNVGVRVQPTDQWGTNTGELRHLDLKPVDHLPSGAAPAGQLSMVADSATRSTLWQVQRGGAQPVWARAGYTPTGASFGLPGGTGPVRLYDTRNGSGFAGAGQPLSAGATRTIDSSAAARGAAALLAIVTIYQPSTAGQLKIWPTSQAAPFAPALVYLQGQRQQVTVPIALDPAGRFNAVINAGSAHLFVDVWGTFA